MHQDTPPDRPLLPATAAAPRRRATAARGGASPWRVLRVVLAVVACLIAWGAAGQGGAAADDAPPSQGHPADARYWTAAARARFAAEGQADVPPEYRLVEPADIDFVQYTVAWNVLPDLERAVFAPEHFADGTFPVLVGEGGWQLTLKDVQDWFWARGITLSVAEALVTKPELLAEGIAKAAYVDLVEQDAIAAGTHRSAGVATDMRFVRERLLRPVLYEHAYEQSGAQVTDQDVELEYERQKQTIFRTPMTFTIRQIFLRAYEDVEVGPDDADLRAIARAVTGSEAGVLQIRGADRPSRRRWVPERDRDRLAYEAPRPGERLLVPTDAGGWERLFGRAFDVELRLEAGEAFEEVARSTSDDRVPGRLVTSDDLPQYDRLMPELLEAIRTTPIGGWSGPIRSPHGFHFIEVVAREDERFTPLDEVKPRLRQAMEVAAMRAAGEALMEELRSQPVVVIREDVVRATADQALLPLDTVLAEYKGEPLTFDDLFGSDQLRTFFADANVEERLRMIRESRRMNDHLMTDFAEEHGFMARPDVAGARDYYFKFSLAKRFEADVRLEAFRESTPLLYRYYLDHQDRFRQAARYDFILLQKTLPQEASAREGLTKLLERFRDEAPDAARFEELAASLSDDPAVRARRGVFRGVYHADAEHEFRLRLFDAQPGAFLGPFAMRGTLNLLLLTGRENDVVPPFEELFQRVSPIYQQQVFESLEMAEIVRKLREVKARLNPALLSGGAETAAASGAESGAEDAAGGE